MPKLHGRDRPVRRHSWLGAACGLALVWLVLGLALAGCQGSGGGAGGPTKGAPIPSASPSPSPTATATPKSTAVPVAQQPPDQGLAGSLSRPVVWLGVLAAAACVLIAGGALLLFVIARPQGQLAARGRPAAGGVSRTGRSPSPNARLAPQAAKPLPGIPYLEAVRPHAGPVYYPLRQDVATLGRDPHSTLIINEQFAGWQTVSRQHARIERDGGDFVIVDQDSANGVQVNGRRTGQNILRDGCTVSIGQVQFTFRLNAQGGTS